MHFLLIVDDDDFYTRQQPFNLAQQRAIATALNTLIFRTHCPDRRAASKGTSRRRRDVAWEYCVKLSAGQQANEL